jgi:YcxB-like protein
MPLTFAMDVRLDELQRASRAVQNQQRFFRWMVRLSLFSPIFLVLVGWLSKGDLRQALLDNVWFAVFILGMMLVVVPWLQRRTVSKAYHANPAMQGQQTYEFSPEGLRMAGPLSSVTVAWPGIISAVETSEFLLFFVQKSLAYYLPKRAVQRSTELDELRALVLRQLGERATLFRPVAVSVAAA